MWTLTLYIVRQEENRDWYAAASYARALEITIVILTKNLAVAHCKAGKGLVKVNGKPLYLVQPQVLRFKVYEPLLILGLDKFGAYEHNVEVELGD